MHILTRSRRKLLNGVCARVCACVRARVCAWCATDVAQARCFVRALEGTTGFVVYVGGADSLDTIQAVLGFGCGAVQLGRPLLREPWFVRRLEKALAARQQRAGGGVVNGELARGGGDAVAEEEVISKCTRCNRCTLAAIDPVKFAGGCVLLTDGEGSEYECVQPPAVADLEDLANGGVALGCSR